MHVNMSILMKNYLQALATQPQLLQYMYLIKDLVWYVIKIKVTEFKVCRRKIILHLTVVLSSSFKNILPEEFKIKL